MSRGKVMMYSMLHDPLTEPVCSRKWMTQCPTMRGLLAPHFFARRRRSGLMGFGVRSVKALKAQGLKPKP